MRKPLAVITTGFLLLIPFESLHCTECVALPPLKLIHHVCGFVVDPSGKAVARATVTVLNDSEEIATTQTSADGNFTFDQLKPGSYNLRVQATGFVTAYSSIILAKPKAICKKQLGVSLGVGMMCSGISLGKLKRPKPSD